MEILHGPMYLKIFCEQRWRISITFLNSGTAEAFSQSSHLQISEQQVIGNVLHCLKNYYNLAYALKIDRKNECTRLGKGTKSVLSQLLFIARFSHEKLYTFAKFALTLLF